MSESTARRSDAGAQLRILNLADLILPPPPDAVKSAPGSGDHCDFIAGWIGGLRTMVWNLADEVGVWQPPEPDPADPFAVLAVEVVTITLAYHRAVWGLRPNQRDGPTGPARAALIRERDHQWCRLDTRLTDVVQYTPENLARFRDAIRCVVRQMIGVAPPERPARSEQAKTKVKNGTGRGAGRDKLIAALTEHHKYQDGSCLHLEPISVSALARHAGVGKATASEFFAKHFKGYAKYKAHCRDAGRLADAIKALRGEFAPHELYGRRPPSEDDRDE